jgi:CarboxypepD_reg-like domain
MFLKDKSYSYFISFITITAISLMPGNVFSQTTIDGKVTYKDDVTPAAFVNVEIQNRKGIETMTNFAGNFSLRVPDSKSNDTVVISSVGYKSLKLPLYIAAKRKEFILSEIVKNMNGVTVFNSHEVIGSNSETVGYYRSWDSKKTGGEIGRIFKLSYKKFKIDKIRFKAGNTCDTCLLRLHIRKVVDGLPADEILTDSISLFVNNLSLDTKIPEFDLTPYDLTLTEKEFFVGIEVLNCGNGKKGFCSFSFAGTEKGEYVFKSKTAGEWNTTDDYTIYLKLFLRF